MPSKRVILLAFLCSAFAAAGASVYYHAKNKEARIPASPEAAHTETVSPEPAVEATPPFVSAPAEEKSVTSKPARQLPASSKKLEVQSAELKPKTKPTEDEAGTDEQEAASIQATGTKQLDLTEELQEERKDLPASFHPDASPNVLVEKKMAADPIPIKAEVPAQVTEQNDSPVTTATGQPENPAPALDVQTETKVTVKLPEEPKPVDPAIIDSPAPALPPSEADIKPIMHDFIYFSPKLGYHAVKTNRASNGQLIQLSTKLSPTITLGFKQDWSDGVGLFAEGSVNRYSFNDISGVTTRNLSGTSYAAKLGAEFEQTKHLGISFYAGLGENFAVNVDTANVVEPVRYSRPEAGMELNLKLHRTETASISLKPRAAYALPGARNGDKSQGHLEYGLKVSFEHRSPASLHGTGAEIEFSKAKFNSAQGSNGESSLGIGLNFSIGF